MYNIQRPLRRATVAVATALLTTVALAACGDAAHDAGDTAVAAPATVLTPDNPGPPDSTLGVLRERTGSPGVAGARVTEGADSARTPRPEVLPATLPGERRPPAP